MLTLLHNHPSNQISAKMTVKPKVKRVDPFSNSASIQTAIKLNYYVCRLWNPMRHIVCESKKIDKHLYSELIFRNSATCENKSSKVVWHNIYLYIWYIICIDIHMCVAGLNITTNCFATIVRCVGDCLRCARIWVCPLNTWRL